MATHEDFGVIEKTAENKMYTLQIKETHIEWKIHDIITVIENKNITTKTLYSSPFFSIDDVSYVLDLYPVSELDNAFMRLFLSTTKGKQEYFLVYDISLKKLDGSEEHLVSGVLKEKGTDCDMGNIVKRSELNQRKSELAPHNVLTIICRFKPKVVPPSAQPVAPDKLMLAELIRLDKLSENFKDLFADKETCDVTLKVKDKDFGAHRSVLMARSKVFAANFKHDTLEYQTGVITITDCDPDSFQEFLDYLYSGKLEALSYHSALNLYYTSDKYDVQELKVFCVEKLIQCVSVENICEIAVFADQFDEAKLFEVVQDFFNENYLRIFLISEWGNLMKRDYRLAEKLLAQMSKTKLKN